MFAALVPTPWPPGCDPDIYVIDITTWLVNNDLGRAKTLTLSSNFVWAATDRHAVRSFLDDAVPAATARRLCMMLGVVGTMPTASPAYSYLVPNVPVERHATKILGQIRTTAAFSIVLMAMDERSDRSLWRRLAHVLAAFRDDGHWETHAARACSHVAEGRRVEAVKAFRDAIRSIERDPKLRDILSTETWAGTLAFLRRMEARCRGRSAGRATTA